MFDEDDVVWAHFEHGSDGKGEGVTGIEVPGGDGAWGGGVSAQHIDLCRAAGCGIEAALFEEDVCETGLLAVGEREAALL